PNALGSALGLSSRAVSSRSTLPVLGNVLLETQTDGLRVTATNLDLTVSCTVPATVAEEGRTTVPARLLAEYTSSLAEMPCSMELDPGTQVLKLTCGVHTTKLHGIDAAEFPPMPQPDGEPIVEVDAPTFEGAINQTTMAASGDEGSPVLTGVLVQIEENRLTLAATDRHRLAVKTIEVRKLRDAESEIGTLIVPARHLNEVSRA